MIIRSPRKLGSQGFTIVELMIALAILSTILIMCTVIMIQVGTLYTKGVNQANLQSVSRNIVADVSAAIQFGGTPPFSCTQPTNPSVVPTCDAASITENFGGPNPSQTVYAFCIGNIRYSYVLNRELGTDTISGETTSHVLWRDTMLDSSSCVPLDITVSTPHDTNTQPGSVAGTYDGYEMMGNHMRLDSFEVGPPVGNTYGVNVFTAYGDSDLLTGNITTGHFNCNGGTGTQFCATSELGTVVTQRVQ